MITLIWRANKEFPRFVCSARSFMFCIVVKEHCLLHYLNQKIFSSASNVCFNFSSYSIIVQDANKLCFLPEELKIAWCYFERRCIITWSLKPERWNSSGGEIKKKGSLRHPAYRLWNLFLFRVINDNSDILIWLWNTRLMRDISKYSNTEQPVIKMSFKSELWNNFNYHLLC